MPNKENTSIICSNTYFHHVNVLEEHNLTHPKVMEKLPYMVSMGCAVEQARTISLFIVTINLLVNIASFTR